METHKKKITLLLLFKNEYARAGIICVHVKYQDTLLLFISSFFFYFFFNYVCFPFLFLCVCNVWVYGSRMVSTWFLVKLCLYLKGLRAGIEQV